MTLQDEKIRLIMELRQMGIADTGILSALERVPRDKFISKSFRSSAYDNSPLPIECGQTISQPYVVAFMTEALRLEKNMRVLEIGTGSGYQAAVLAQLCRRVYTIERHKPLMALAEARFRDMGLDNISTRVGDGAKGWPEVAPVERIIVTAAAAEVPAALYEQLSEGGIMVIPVGDETGPQEIMRITRTKTGFDREEILSVRFVPLVGEETS
ncbi:MAG: protein-L-isoaspartate(D-aspartate) O-methyltransferase [Rhodospirillaceae bacterium]|jgi:protein-L-isoaspartate(D-aspartate) O-methyltransferase|nr:protein-L-isoaspartate(D-aspartate) O-methyltransferase [Rhodospirillaceae bacterium]MBT5373719.1 protein-L-isoaspartate(D-aspartate) O-methyltransferase [Rhodospirillaceae bacterium]MBT5660095.1 protein-L-isoaspartate(D-aspartate) O-methyltransferase [Rhodospirillaceae bacterium]MBT5751938.1 protein-L-isoaspartate(D-aspartate) O-methyltransferase [Rhodospirillaceae bacterium]